MSWADHTPLRDREVRDVTVLLTVFKRETLKQQLAALENQTIVPKEVVVYHDCDFQKIPKRKLVKRGVQVVENSWNTKYIGRFAYLINAPTEWIAVVDDDLILGPDCLRSYLDQAETLGAIVGGMGRIGRTNPLRGTLDQPPDVGLRPHPTLVDFVGQMWVFRKELLFDMFSVPPSTYATGEDMHLCFSAKLKSGVPSYVAAQPTEDSVCDLAQGKYSGDKFASYKTTPKSDRADVETYFTQMGLELIGLEDQARSREHVATLGL